MDRLLEHLAATVRNGGPVRRVVTPSGHRSVEAVTDLKDGMVSVFIFFLRTLNFPLLFSLNFFIVALRCDGTWRVVQGSLLWQCIDSVEAKEHPVQTAWIRGLQRYARQTGTAGELGADCVG